VGFILDFVDLRFGVVVAVVVAVAVDYVVLDDFWEGQTQGSSK